MLCRIPKFELKVSRKIPEIMFEKIVKVNISRYIMSDFST